MNSDHDLKFVVDYMKCKSNVTGDKYDIYFSSLVQFNTQAKQKESAFMPKSSLIPISRGLSKL